MDVFKLAEKAMRMGDEAWARHANPLSGWSRFSCLPLLCLAVWSRTWIGWWSLAAVVGAVFWTWLNPRLFPPPRSTDNWASQGVLGERLFLNRKQTPIPKCHERMGLLLAWLSATGLPPLAFGLWVLDFWAVLAGISMTILPKLWFIDRMVWLYRDMPDAAADG